MGEQEFISLCRRRVAQYYVIEKGKKEYDYSASSNSKIDNIYVVEEKLIGYGFNG